MNTDKQFDPIHFLFDMIQLLDDRDWQGWLARCDPDVSYVLTNHENIRRGGNISLINDNYQRLMGRIKSIEEFWHAEKPPTRTNHIIGNARVQVGTDGIATVRSNVLASAVRRDRQIYLTGQSTDVLKPVDSTWRLLKRVVILDKDLLDDGQITFIV